jgi:small ligand-binding sensory domain FIST
LHKLLEPEVFVGTTAVGVAGGGIEVEDAPGLSVLAASFSAGRVAGVALESVETSDGVAIVGWPDSLPSQGTLLMLADPFSFPVPDFLQLCNARVPEMTVVGGLASAGNHAGTNRLVLDGEVYTSGAVAVMCSEDVPVRAVVSQGCRPIGAPLTVTGAERNFVHELAGQPAMRRLQEIVEAVDDDERELMRNGLHMGLVVDEHKLDFRRGDFLVRNVLGADQKTGSLAVGDHVTVGQTVQFHVRDADAADDDLRYLLRGLAADAALLFTCNGRGRRMFATPNHDARVVEDQLGTIPLAGAFCAGEIGPVGGCNFLHGFTASLAVFEA